MHITGIGFLNTIPWNIMFTTGSRIKNLKGKNIKHLSKDFNKLYLQRDLKITCIHADSEFEPLHAEMANIGIYLHLSSKK